MLTPPRLHNLHAAISALQKDGRIPTISQTQWDGGQCRIYKANFADGESWVIRIPIHVKTDSRDVILELLRDEGDKIEMISKTGFPWLPKLRETSLTFDNELGWPFIALSWVEGSPLHWDDSTPPRPFRNKVLEQLASIQVSLIESTKSNSLLIIWLEDRVFTDCTRRHGFEILLKAGG
jgi:aminoglycoside phosphotransferase (APT) family kinase protein